MEHKWNFLGLQNGYLNIYALDILCNIRIIHHIAIGVIKPDFCTGTDIARKSGHGNLCYRFGNRSNYRFRSGNPNQVLIRCNIANHVAIADLTGNLRSQSHGLGLLILNIQLHRIAAGCNAVNLILVNVCRQLNRNRIETADITYIRCRHNITFGHTGYHRSRSPDRHPADDIGILQYLIYPARLRNCIGIFQNNRHIIKRF